LESIYSILAAVIHLGDLDVVADENDSERCRLTNPGQAAIGEICLIFNN
jgi:myosin heavy subunit